ncbi:HET-domain-containing protein [Hypoxylon sp. EC38]|nr:HET-domain-containing protein [Hypoxylon sp. EC38]
MSLCQRCEEFNIQSLSKLGSTLKFDLGEVRAASNDGCKFCTLLVNRVSLEWITVKHLMGEKRGPLYVQLSTDHPRSERKKTVHCPNILQVDRLYLLAAPSMSQPTLVGASYPLKLMKELGCLVLTILSDSPAAKSGDVTGRLRDATKDKHRADIITEWLANCLQHPKCRETASGSQFDVFNQPLPARCVHIKFDSGGNMLFRLDETGGQHGTYVILSHRWNSQTELTRTTTSNYVKRKGGDFGFLPAVFLEAMKVALSQSIQYIWIDSLCIIQEGDGGADWRKEAVHMAEYYQHATFTIMSAVTLPYDGLFRAQPRSDLIRLPYRDKHSRRSGNLYAINPEHMLYYRVQDAKIFWRGWVFQEWMLSRRLVNFTDYGIFFTCQSSNPLFEDLGELPDHFYRTPLAELKTFFNSRTPAEEIWCYLMRFYAAASLTKKEDRLIAVAGIAKEYRRILVAQNEADLRYVTGLWMCIIHRGLLWHRIRVITKVPYERLPTQPSWSWTSAIAIVDWPATSYTTDIRNDCIITPCEEIESEQQLIKIQPRLAVRGKMLPVVVRQEIPWKGDSADTIRKMADFKFLSPEILFRDEKKSSFRAVCSVSKPGLIAGWGSFEGESIQARLGSGVGISVFALLVRTRRVENFGATGVGSMLPYYSVYDVLFLDPVMDREDEYCRVGAGSLFEPELLEEFSPLLATDIILV